MKPPTNPYRQNDSKKPESNVLRERIASLFHTDLPERIAICSGSTEALNIAINGLVNPGGHVISTMMEHNSVLRPLYHLENKGDINLDLLACDPMGDLNLIELESSIQKDTCFIVVNHVSNVTGHVQNIQEIYSVADKHRIPLLIDISQSAGAMKINLAEMPRSLAAFTGHKSLMGPSGTGGLVIGKDVEPDLWKVGGTGIRSDLKTMPDMWPLKYEAGTPNHPGIAGLGAALDYLMNNEDELWQKKKATSDLLWRKLSTIDEVQLFSEPPEKNPCGVFSFKLDGWQCKDLGYVLQESFGIHVRTGLHCAPLIHSAMGTFSEGTVRVSLSPFNTETEVETFVEAIESIKVAA